MYAGTRQYHVLTACLQNTGMVYSQTTYVAQYPPMMKYQLNIERFLVIDVFQKGLYYLSQYWQSFIQYFWLATTS